MKNELTTGVSIPQVIGQPKGSPARQPYVAPRLTGKRSLESITLSCAVGLICRPTPGGPGFIGDP